MGKLGKKVIRLLESHPEGIPISNLAMFYNQKYHRNLAVANAGFSSVADFISSLTEHLEVKNETVFHKKHLLQTQDTTEKLEVAQSNLKGIFFSFSQRLNSVLISEKRKQFAPNSLFLFY